MDTATSANPAELLWDDRRQAQYVKPQLRGWFHLVAFEVALVLGTLIIATAQGSEQTTIASIYAVSVAGMFGASALYHRGNWTPVIASRLQRLDHLMIFLVIAGSATPPIAVCISAPGSWIWLGIIWTLTLIVAVGRQVRMQLPEWVAGSIFIGLGWSAGAALPAVWIHSGVAPGLLLIVGGLLYMVGAISYHYRVPDPVPSVFGYHEVFHLIVTAAAACQYVAIACYLL